MKRSTKETQDTKVTGLEALLQDASLNSEVKKRMTEAELIKFVWDNFEKEEIKSKNGMLKFLRAEGLSCSMDRVFKAYALVEQEKKKEAKEAKPDNTKAK
jgi:hypothetical protein